MYDLPYFVPSHSSDLTRQSSYNINGEYQNVLDFIYTMNSQGFTVQEGSINYIDILKLCSEGKVDSALGNNVGAPYAICLLPPAPDQEPSQGQQPPIGYNPANPNNYPANIDYIAPGFASKLRPDEAIVLIGRTPPPALYYSFRSYLGFVQNQPDKDYSDYITAGNELDCLVGRSKYWQLVS